MVCAGYVELIGTIYDEANDPDVLLKIFKLCKIPSNSYLSLTLDYCTQRHLPGF